MPESLEAPRLELSISISVLNHLGVKLYSSIPAVLSEVIANAWDADATEVSINIDKDNHEITITDNGIGMTVSDINEKFLRVGYQRREAGRQEGRKERTPMDRLPMGRKGIGKLALLSMANLVLIETAKNGQKTAFILDYNKIEEQIRREKSSEEGTYEPEVLMDHLIGFEHGTRITLRKLKTKVNINTLNATKNRLTRRFSTIGEDSNFHIFVDGERIYPNQDELFKHVQMLWTYFENSGEKYLKNTLPNTRNGIKVVQRDDELFDSLYNSEDCIKFSGWIASVEKPSDLKVHGDNLNGISVYMRGKLAQEDILKELDSKELFNSYLTGQIYCDELDDEDYDDIATSNRQYLSEDDERFLNLKRIIKIELTHFGREWMKMRGKLGSEKVKAEFPFTKTWLSKIESPQERELAEKWIGKIYTIRTQGAIDDSVLLKGAILTFETYQNRKELELLNSGDYNDVKHLFQIFNNINHLEFSYYGQIVKIRLEAIRKLEQLITENDLEKHVQSHLFENLWLLDPSWERATAATKREITIENFLKTDRKLNKKIKSGCRLDIAFRTIAGRHVIIELKRPQRKLKYTEVMDQCGRYRAAAIEQLGLIMNNQNDRVMHHSIEFVMVLGTPVVSELSEQETNDILRQASIRILYFDELLDTADRIYSEYLEEKGKHDRLWEVFNEIEDFTKGQAGK